MLNIDIKTGGHSMEIPEGMSDLVRTLFSYAQIDGEFEFMLGMKLKGTQKKQGKVHVVSCDEKSRILRIEAQPGDNKTCHELTTTVPNDLNIVDFEKKLRKSEAEQTQRDKKEIQEEKILKKCIQLFYASNGKFQSGISQKKIRNGECKKLGYKNFQSLYGSVLHVAVSKFGFLIIEGEKFNTTYAWSPRFLAKKTDYEKIHPEIKLEYQRNNESITIKQNTNKGVEEKPLIPKEDLEKMTDDELLDVFCKSDEELKSIRQKISQLENLIKSINDITEERKERARQEFEESLEKNQNALKYLSNEEIIKLVQKKRK